MRRSDVIRGFTKRAFLWAWRSLEWARQAGLQCTLRGSLDCLDNEVQLRSLSFLKHRFDKDDLVQEVRIGIWQVHNRKQQGIKLKNAYLKKVLDSVLLDAINKAKKDVLIRRSVESGLVSGSETKVSVHNKDNVLRQILPVAIRELNEIKQILIRLRLQGFSIKEIARLNGWTYQKTCLMFYRARRELQQVFRRKGI